MKEEDLEPDVGPFGFYVSAFWELSSCRINGMGAGPIPFTAIVDYSKIFDVGDFEDFLYLMRSMDRKFLDLESDRVKKDQNKAKAKAGKKPSDSK